MGARLGLVCSWGFGEEHRRGDSDSRVPRMRFDVLQNRAFGNSETIGGAAPQSRKLVTWGFVRKNPKRECGAAKNPISPHIKRAEPSHPSRNQPDRAGRSPTSSRDRTSRADDHFHGAPVPHDIPSTRGSTVSMPNSSATSCACGRLPPRSENRHEQCTPCQARRCGSAAGV